MKNILITIAAVVLVGCGESQQSTPAEEGQNFRPFFPKPVDPVVEVPAKPPSPVESQSTETVTEAEAPDISIHDAAADENIEAVKQHLAAGTDVNAKDDEGYTPLHSAAEYGCKEVVALLIAEGADVNAKGGRFGNTPLHLALNEGHGEIAELLITKGADINAKNDRDETPLDWGGGLLDFLDEIRSTPGVELKAEVK